MSFTIKQTMILACGIASLPIISAGLSARGDSYPYQGAQNFRTEGVVTLVDADRDRVTITTSDGRQYNLDTDSTAIKLRGTSRPGDTADLVPGMNVEVTGRLLASDIVAADHLTVLPFHGTVPSAPVAPPVVDRPTAPLNTTAVRGEHIRLRGNVENVNDENGVVVVRVNSHVRTVLVNHNTDLSDIHSVDDDHIGLRPGDRVTVSGILQPDGSVAADVISLSKNIGAAVDAADATPPPVDENNAHQVVGRVSHTSDRYMSRDIKVRMDSDREVTIHVPHDARILRNGMSISVHDLTEEDVIRVIGSYDGDGFKATRIEVLQAYQDEQ